jgi:hypothetical protein
MSQEPSSWIEPECAPCGFPWADPSKIRIDNVYLLLDHWRRRQADGMVPLIWASSCPLLEDVGQQSEHSEVSSDAGSDSGARSEDGFRPNSEDGDHTTSDDGSNPNSDNEHTEDGDAGNDTDPKSDDGVGSNAQDNTDSDHEYSHNSNDYDSDDGKKKDHYMEPLPPPARYSLQEGSGIVNSPPIIM